MGLHLDVSVQLSWVDTRPTAPVEHRYLAELVRTIAAQHHDSRSAGTALLRSLPVCPRTRSRTRLVPPHNAGYGARQMRRSALPQPVVPLVVLRRAFCVLFIGPGTHQVGGERPISLGGSCGQTSFGDEALIEPHCRRVRRDAQFGAEHFPTSAIGSKRIGSAAEFGLGGHERSPCRFM